MTSITSRIHSRATRTLVGLVVLLVGLGAAAPTALATGVSQGASGGRAATRDHAPGRGARAADGLPRAAAAGPFRALSRFAHAVSTPGTKQYGDYESVAVASRRFGASPAERARVVAALRDAGATDVSIDATGLYADATLRVGQAERLFTTHVARFASAATADVPAQRFMAPTNPIRIPSALRDDVTGVVGLNTQPLDPDAEPARASAAQVARARRLRSDASADAAAPAAPVTLGVPEPHRHRRGLPRGACPAGVLAQSVPDRLRLWDRCSSSASRARASGSR